MDISMIQFNNYITYGYYAMTFIFSLALVRNLWKSKNWQESVLYITILIPFVLRVLRMK